MGKDGVKSEFLQYNWVLQQKHRLLKNLDDFYQSFYMFYIRRIIN